MPSLSEQMRDALRKSKRPDVEIAAETGIHAVTLSRFKTGAFTLSGENIEKLAAALGVEIHVRKRARNSRRGA